MNSPVHVRYVGPHDQVEVIDGQVDKVAVRGEPLEVSHDLAHGVKGDGEDNVGALGGLLDQPDNWELVKTPKSGKAAEAAPLEEKAQ